MEHPKSLRLWDCALCNDAVEDRVIAPLPLSKVRPPSSLVPLPFGVGTIGGSSFGMLSFFVSINISHLHPES